jgi:serine/threonine protein kinase
MEEYPAKVIIEGSLFKYEKILKDDFFSINVLYRNETGVRYVLKLSNFRFILGKLLRPLAGFFSKREYRIYSRVEDIEGIPPLGPRYGKRGYFHLFIEGKTLHELKNDKQLLPDDFFQRLLKIIEELHRRRIYYLDLDKLGNIILGDDGIPYLIDFQISMQFKKHRGILGKITDAIFNNLIREDLYHLYKHKKRFQPHLLTKEEEKLTERSSFNIWYNRIFGNPYRKVKRLIYPSGSNEVIWYKWKKIKNENKDMP